MVRKRKPPVERYHDRVAARYDHSYDDEYWMWHDALTWDHIKRHLPSNHNAPVLDLGCGTGKWAAKFAKSGYAVTCVDISRKMLDQAERNVGGNSSFIQADLCDLTQLKTDHFALAVALGDPIGCTESPPRALKAIRRVLRDDGVLIATFDNRLNALDYYLQIGDEAELKNFLRTGRTHWLTRDADEQFPIYTYTPAQVRRLMATAGYTVVDMIGKTVLPMRAHRETLLTDSAARRAWAKIEKSLCRDEAAMGRASHLQVVATPAAENLS